MDLRNYKDLIAIAFNLFIVIGSVNPLILIKLEIYPFSYPFLQFFLLLFQFFVFHTILLLFKHIFSLVQVQVWEVLASLLVQELVLEELAIKQRLILQYFLVSQEEPFIKKLMHKLHKPKQYSLEQQEDLELQPQDFFQVLFFLFSGLMLEFSLYQFS